jgi:flagellar biosynthesis GTPase FlhF
VKSSDSLESPTSLERELFANSAYSNPFWSDSIDAEDRQILRDEIARRHRLVATNTKTANEYRKKLLPWWTLWWLMAVSAVVIGLIGVATPGGEVTAPLLVGIWLGIGSFVSLLVLLFFSAMKEEAESVVNAGVTYRWPWIYKRSVARFEQWLGSMGSTDPHLYAEVVNWLQRERQHAEEMARLAAIQRAQEAAEAEQRYQEQRYQEQERKAASAAWTAQHHAAWNEQRIREHDEGDRRRAEANYQYEQEQARQAAYQASQDARRSEPTCAFCDRPGMHQTASGWMCGIHLHHLM